MVQCAHLEKYEFVNGKDDIPYMKWEKNETTNRFFWIFSKEMGFGKHQAWKRWISPKRQAESWKLNWSINLWHKSCFDMSWSISSDPASQWHPAHSNPRRAGRRVQYQSHVFWLVVEPNPSEKWWSESQLGWWNSQYMLKVIKFHGSKPPTSFNPKVPVLWPKLHDRSARRCLFPPIFQHIWPQNLRRVS